MVMFNLSITIWVSRSYTYNNFGYEHNRTTRVYMLLYWCPWKITANNPLERISLKMLMSLKYFTFLQTIRIQDGFIVIKKFFREKLLKYYDAAKKTSYLNLNNYVVYSRENLQRHQFNRYKIQLIEIHLFENFPLCILLL